MYSRDFRYFEDEYLYENVATEKAKRARFLNDEEFDKKYTSTRSEPGSKHSIKQVQSAARAHRKNPNLSGKDLHKIASAVESYDLYDIILSHLLDEGYANTVESAEVILENMSEGWMESIMEAKIDTGLKSKNKRIARGERSFGPEFKTMGLKKSDLERRYSHEANRGAKKIRGDKWEY